MNGLTGSLVLFVATLTATACSDASPGHTADAVEAVEELQVDFTRAGNEGDLDGVMRYYSDESALMPAGGGVIRGRDAIREHFRRAFDAADFRIGIEPAEVRVSGDLAFSTGRSGGVVVDRASGDTTRVFTRYLMVLERDPTEPERWTVLRWMWEPVDPT